MKYEDIEKVKEIINAIEEIDNFLNKIVYNGSEIGLLKADRTIRAIISNSDTLVAIDQALNVRRDELIKELETL